MDIWKDTTATTSHRQCVTEITLYETEIGERYLFRKVDAQYLLPRSVPTSIALLLLLYRFILVKISAYTTIESNKIMC